MQISNRKLLVSNITTFIFSVLIPVIIFTVTHYTIKFRDLELSKETYEFRYQSCQEKYKYEEGAVILPGEVAQIEYKLFTNDAGENWYAMDKEGKIIGDANETYPGILYKLELKHEPPKVITVGPYKIRYSAPLKEVEVFEKSSGGEWDELWGSYIARALIYASHAGIETELMQEILQLHSVKQLVDESMDELNQDFFFSQTIASLKNKSRPNRMRITP